MGLCASLKRYVSQLYCHVADAVGIPDTIAEEEGMTVRMCHISRALQRWMSAAHMTVVSLLQVFAAAEIRH
jgi:hypothetical protein